MTASVQHRSVETGFSSPHSSLHTCLVCNVPALLVRASRVVRRCWNRKGREGKVSSKVSSEVCRVQHLQTPASRTLPQCRGWEEVRAGSWICEQTKSPPHHTSDAGQKNIFLKAFLVPKTHTDSYRCFQMHLGLILIDFNSPWDSTNSSWTGEVGIYISYQSIFLTKNRTAYIKI